MAVGRIEITSRQPFANGESFGDVGPYEQLDGTVYFTDSANHLVRRVAPNGTLETVAGSDGPYAETGLNTPYGLTFYGEDILLISEQFGHRIRALKLK